MHIPHSDVAFETRAARRRGGDADSSESSNPLESLLNCSIRLRDLYRHARGRANDCQLVDLRRIFDTHHKEQVRLVDALIDRARSGGAAGRIFAGTFLRDPKPFWDSRSRHAAIRMLQTLLDAHEQILSVALLGSAEQQEDVWIRDLAVGQVVLANEEQRRAIGDLLGNRCDDSNISIPFRWNSD
jgi:hypothetical protein